MNGSGREQTLYPRLPQLLPEELLTLVATLEPAERDFAGQAGSLRQQYLRALYIKAGGYLGYFPDQPGQLPRQLRVRLAQGLGLGNEYADILRFQPGERDAAVQTARQYCQMQPLTPSTRGELRCWLVDGPAREEAETIGLINRTVQRARTTGLELPPFQELGELAQQALMLAERQIENEFDQQLSGPERTMLDGLLGGGESTSALDTFKAAVADPSPETLRQELQRLAQLQGQMPARRFLVELSRRKLESFAEVGSRCTAGELRQLRPARRRTVLACYLVMRRAQLLDGVVELLRRVWDKTCYKAKTHADECRRQAVKADETHREILRDLVGLIRASANEGALWRNIHNYQDGQKYELLWKELESQRSWNDSYFGKLQDHYGALRRFLPEWYEHVPLIVTIADDSILQAIDFIKENASSVSPYLPVARAPVQFLPREWQTRALERHAWTGETIRIHKNAYELGLLEAMSTALDKGTLAVTDAQRYAPVTDHLLPRSDFLAEYSAKVAGLGLPDTAEPYCAPLRERLEQAFQKANEDYPKSEEIFWINKKGRLSFSRTPRSVLTGRQEKLINQLLVHIGD